MPEAMEHLVDAIAEALGEGNFPASDPTCQDDAWTALRAIPDGWAKVNGSWFRMSEYEAPECATFDCCLLPPVPLYELQDDDWNK